MDSSILVNEERAAESDCSRTQALEMDLQEALRTTDAITRDEDSRRLRLRILMLEHENDDLHEQLALSDDRIDNLEQECEDLRLRLDRAQEDATRREKEGRLLNRELNNLKAELESMNNVTTDSTKLLKEKLAIARELASIQPELEHLRTQASFQQKVLSEKLSLERQVRSLEVELEAEKRAVKHATRKTNNVEREEDLQRQLDEAQANLKRVQRENEKAAKSLQKELDAERKTSKRAAQKADSSLVKETEIQQQLDEANETIRNLQKELEVEQNLAKRVAQRSTTSQEKEGEIQQQLEEALKTNRDLRNDLKTAQMTAKRATQNSTTSPLKEVELQQQLEEAQDTIHKLQKVLDAEQKSSKRTAQKSNASVEKETELHNKLEEAQKELAQEKWEADRSRKDAQKELKASESRETVIESKLDQMRVKLRATKDQLKECQAELVQAQAVKAPKANGKRKAREMSTDEAIGTPDGLAARGKRPSIRNGRPDQTAVGEKSMFSITPYLNKTINLALNSSHEESENAEQRAEASDDEQATLADPACPASPAEMGESSPIAVQPKKKKSVVKAPTEDQILAESKPSAKNRKPARRKPKTISTLEKVTEEVDENEEEPEPKAAEISKAASQPRKKQIKPILQNVEGDDVDQKKKKRKLLSSNKTLFEEEEGGEGVKRPAKIILGPARLAVKGGLASRKTGLKPSLTAPSAFAAFSPLKKDRRGVGASFLG